MKNFHEKPRLSFIQQKKKVVYFVTERAEAFTLYSSIPETREYWEYQNRLEGLEEFYENTDGLW